jgi:hypothetical protein
MKRKRGRPSNFDGIVKSIGWSSWVDLCNSGRIGTLAQGAAPDLDAIMRLGRATLGAAASAERNAKNAAQKVKR